MNWKMIFALGFCLSLISIVSVQAIWKVGGVDVCAGADCENDTQSPGPNYLVNLTAEDEDGNEQILNISVYKTDTEDLINRYSIDGNVSFPLNDSKIDMDIDYDESNLQIKLKGLNVSNLNGKNSKVIVNDVMIGDFPDISTTYVLVAYKVELPSDFNFTQIVLKIKYSHLPVTDENNLLLYKCSNYNLTSDTCVSGWIPVNATIDKNNHLVTATINGFSVYGLGEKENNSSTTTTTTTSSTTSTTTTTSTSQPPSTGGSSSGGVYIPPASSATTTTTRSTTTTSQPKTTTTTSQSTTTTQTKTTTISQYFTGMATFLKSNSYTIAIPIVIAAGLVAGWIIFKNKTTTSHKSSYFKPQRYQGKNKKKYSYDETRLVLS